MLGCSRLLAAIVLVLITLGCGDDNPVVQELAEGPPPPEWVHVSRTSANQIDLNWDDVATNEGGFQIERSLQAGGGFAWHDTVAADTEEYIDTTQVSTGETYHYRILAFDLIGRRGEASTEIWATAHDNATPQTPFDPDPIADAAELEGPVTLHWSSADEDGEAIYYDVYFGQSRIGMDRLAAGITDTTFAVDQTLDLTRSYFWRIVAADTLGATALSPIWSFATRIERVEIPAGYFFRGDCGEYSPANPGLYCDDENPHEVDLFYIDKYEVTNQLFAQYLQKLFDGKWIYVADGMALSRVGDTLFARTYPDGDEHSGIRYTGSNDDPGDFVPRAGRENHPVVEVTWYGANRYALSLGRRLPTEVEWERAARGTAIAYGDTLIMLPDSSTVLAGYGPPYPWGAEADAHSFNYSGSGDPFETRVGVGTTPAGFYNGSTRDGYATNNNAAVWGSDGVFDMCGNVAEWCQDRFTPDEGGGYGNLCVVKGGSWRSEPHWCQLFWRVGVAPEYADNSIGFRTVSSAGP